MAYAATNTTGRRWTPRLTISATRSCFSLCSVLDERLAAGSSCEPKKSVPIVRIRQKRVLCADSPLCTTLCVEDLTCTTENAKRYSYAVCDFCCLVSKEIYECLSKDAIVAIVYALLAMLLNCNEQVLAFLHENFAVDFEYEKAVPQIVTRVLCECACEEGADKDCCAAVRLFWNRLKRFKWQALYRAAQFDYDYENPVCVLLNGYFNMCKALQGPGSHVRLILPFNIRLFDKNLALTARFKQLKNAVSK